MSDKGAPLECECGQRYGLEGGKSLSQDLSESEDNDDRILEASFVHLPSSLMLQDDLRNLLDQATTRFGRETNELVRHIRHLETLEQVANIQESPTPSLCLDCVQRIEKALRADTERLIAERDRYIEIEAEERAREASMRRTLQHLHGDGGGYSDQVDRAERAYLDEIEALKEACLQHEEELRNLQSIHSNQLDTLDTLAEMQSDMFHKFNAFEIETRSYEEDLEELTKKHAKADDEVDRLCSPDVGLPSKLYKIWVDKDRGLRYPLINQLRLAYRPKGDIDWGEIQEVWSLVLQLLLMLATIYDYDSNDWKVVALTQEPKLIQYAKDSEGNTTSLQHSLGHPHGNGRKSIIAFCELLHELLQHAKQRIEELCQGGLLDKSTLPTIPYEASKAMMGDIALAHVAESDDSGWAKVLHMIAANMLWLSDVASVYLAEKVSISSLL